MSDNHKFTVVQLPNAYLVSIQHSDTHYCGPDSVEVAVIYKGKFICGFPYEEHGVASYVKAPQLVEIIEWAREQRSTEHAKGNQANHKRQRVATRGATR
jgi:hypothetical protein